MSVYTNEHLFGDVCQYKGRLRVAADRKEEVYREVWNALNDWIYVTFTGGRAVNIPFFGLITWVVKDEYEGEVGKGKFVKKRKAKFLTAKRFIDAHFLDMKHRDGKELVLVKQEEFNATRLAIKYSTILTKDAVFSGARDIFERIGLVAANGVKMCIDFDIGRLLVKKRRLSFSFNPDIVVAQNNPQLSVNQASIDFGGEDKSDQAGTMFALPQGPNADGANEGKQQQEEADGELTTRLPEVHREDQERAELLEQSVEEEEEQAQAMREREEMRLKEREDLEQQRKAMQVEVDVDSMTEEERLAHELKLATAAISDLQTPVMQGAYLRHIEAMKARIKAEHNYLLQTKEERDAIMQEEQLNLNERRRENLEHVEFLSKQARQRDRERDEMQRESRRKNNVTLPVLAESEANQGAGPHGPQFKRHTAVDKQNMKKMNRVLVRQMQRKAAVQAEEREEKLEEEKRFIAHVKRVEESERQRHFSQLQEKNNALLAEWEHDRLLKNLEKNYMPRKLPRDKMLSLSASGNPVAARSASPSSTTGADGALMTGRSAMSNFSVGYDFRGPKP